MGRLAPRGEGEPGDWLTASPYEVEVAFVLLMRRNRPWPYPLENGEDNAEDK